MYLPPAADLRPRFAAFGLDPRSQGRRGTCSIFAVVGVLEFELAANRRGGKRLSVEFLNWASHRTNGRAVDGSFFSDALNGLREYGVCTENLLPYADNFDPNLAPPPEALTDARKRRGFVGDWIKPWDVKTGLTEEQMAAIRRNLAEGHPVAAGMRWPKQSRFGAGHLMATPPAADVFDGHSIVLVGYDEDRDTATGGGTFLFRNSSGPDWEERGYARLSFDYARIYINDAVAARLDGG